MKPSHALFEHLVHSLAAELYNYARLMCRDHHLAEDLVQETFLRAWKSWKDLRDTRAVKGWMYTILRREYLRCAKRREPFTIDPDAIDIAGIATHDTSTEAFVLRRAAAGLKPDHLEPLLLQVIAGFDTKEMANILKTTLGAVTTRLHRARRQLRAVLSGNQEMTKIERRS